MNTKNISPKIIESLKLNVQHEAPDGLRLQIMMHVQKHRAPHIAPPSNIGVLVIGLFFALCVTVAPFVSNRVSLPSSLFIQLPTIDIPTAYWLSAIAIGLLYAADKFLSTAKLKHILR